MLIICRRTVSTSVWTRLQQQTPSLRESLHSTFPPPRVVSVSGVCLFGVVLIAGACVFGLCWVCGERARCRADGVPSAPRGPAVPSTLLSHRERQADRLLQGENHFLSPFSFSPAYTQNGDIITLHQPLLPIDTSSSLPFSLPSLFSPPFPLSHFCPAATATEYL